MLAQNQTKKGLIRSALFVEMVSFKNDALIKCHVRLSDHSSSICIERTELLVGTFFLVFWKGWNFQSENFSLQKFFYSEQFLWLSAKQLLTLAIWQSSDWPLLQILHWLINSLFCPLIQKSLFIVIHWTFLASAISQIAIGQIRSDKFFERCRFLERSSMNSAVIESYERHRWTVSFEWHSRRWFHSRPLNKADSAQCRPSRRIAFGDMSACLNFSCFFEKS